MDLIARLNAALAGRYRVERVLGEGGMATVYLATDLRHHRNVALKVLKPDLAAAIGADRFLAEIDTTANLQHPHILPLHDSGEADGLLFYTMPFVEGETLRQRLDRERQLPVDEAVRTTTEIAGALQVAHEGGVIHRDIKPSNILFSRGKALVADFGIARVVESSEDRRLTQVGGILGTAGYMSPEQASGRPDVDQRSDIYSLACVLFEMLAGDPPYAGRTVLDVLVKQATGRVPSVRARRPEIPSALSDVVSKALAREPEHRFVNVAEFAAACERGLLPYLLLDPSHALNAVRLFNSLATPDAEAAKARRAKGPVQHAAQTDAPTADTPPGRVLLVLPFVNRSADLDNEYFSDGLTDEVISDLAQISALRVISRNSAMALKGTTKDTPTLARELGVTHLVTGTVRRAGASLRVTAELVDASTDTPMWAEKFSGSMDDVFGIQEEISQRIVAALQVKLTASEARGVAERPIGDPVAYDSYLRACQLMINWTPEAQLRAARLVDEALALTGEVPLLLAMRGQLHWNLVNIPGLPSEGALDRATALVERALALDPDCHLAIFVRGLVAGTRGQPEAGLVDLRRAHELRPGDVNVLLELGRWSMAAGLDCKAVVDRLNALDPLTAQSPLLEAMYYGLYGPVEHAAAPARRAIELAPEGSLLHVSGSWWLSVAGARDEAVALLDRVAENPRDLRAAVATFLRCALVGDPRGAQRALPPETERTISNEFLALMLAAGYALLGQVEDALRCLRAGVRLGFINHPAITRSAALAGCLGDEPRFHALLAEIEPRWKAIVDWDRGLADATRTLATRPWSAR